VEFVVAIFSVVRYEVFKHCIIVLLVSVVYVPSSFSSVVNLVLVLIFPDAILYTVFQRLTPSFILQNVFHDFSFAFCLHTRVFHQSTYLFSPVLNSYY
jgi:hypothetical protein